MILELTLADRRGLAWAQAQVQVHHYLHAPVDSRCSPLAYIVRLGDEPVGCLIFGRPEATRCYEGGLTYGSRSDVTTGRAMYDRWEIINLARVWLSPIIQRSGVSYVPNAATWAIGQALNRVPVEYLRSHPPCFLDEPWRLKACLSYCDTAKHHGTVYRAANFTLARRNAAGIETWHIPLRSLRQHEAQQIAALAQQSQHSRVHRSRRACRVTQEALQL